jgi:hypothetical protein
LKHASIHVYKQVWTFHKLTINRRSIVNGWFYLTVEPIESGVRGVVGALGLATVRSTPCGQDAVNKGDTLAATGIPQVEPINSASTFRASGSRSGSLDTVYLLSNEELVGLVEVESGDTSSVKEVATKVGDAFAETFNLERLFLGERIGERGTIVIIAAQRDFSGIKNIRRERSPFLGC